MTEPSGPVRILQRGHGLWRRFRAGITLGVRVVLEKDGGIVLVRHSYVPGWHFPGGGVDGGETAVDAARREVREETGIDVSEAPKLFGFYYNPSPGARDHVAFFRCTDFTLPDRWPARSLEILDCRLFGLDDLPDNLSGATGRRIAELYEGAPLDPRW